ncbi:MAG TPA: trypsin-like serine protease [Oligoflexus sp.]|uniref:trypsin-like serine protease n=1 Tax=Oligoflexus sp. TaxID=1971216 RepID=UPI002D39BB68|nr:trypsin-like serine protease [Oligoflexus sp.]HYX33964.1 trypsin-like serine protease [Oligoflexus sp.]
MTFRSHVFFVSILYINACGTESASKLDIIGGQKEPSDKLAKGAYPSTIGFTGLAGSGIGASACTGSRLTQNTFITAAHCLNKARVGEEVNIFASNSRKFTAFIKKVQIHPTWVAPTDSGVGHGSDVALFELSFAVREEKTVWDGLVNAVPFAFGTFPDKDLPVIIAGFGCEQKTGFGRTAECEKSPGYQYIKSAQNKIYKAPLSTLNNLEREFRLDASTNKEGITGFTSSGDSGGPVLTLDGRLIGITRSSHIAYYTGDDAYFGTTAYTWLEYPDVKQWLTSALNSESKVETYQDADRVTVEFLNGDRYIGAVRNGFRTGKGTMFYHYGKTYEGDWLMNARSGYGEQGWPEGSKYISYHGGWANDLPNGKGTMTFTSGQVYTGIFKDAKFNGEGQLKYPDGNVQSGTFSAGKREGLFTLVTASGETWKETYSNDVRTSAEKIN